MRILLALACLVLAEAKWIEVGPSVDVLNRIIGGSEATPGDWPWQMSLTFSGSHTCGAVLVDRGQGMAHNRAVTAAHCTVNRNPAMFDLKAGIHFLADSNQDFGVSHIEEHENYNQGSATFANDICVLFMEGNADLDDPMVDSIPTARDSENHGDFIGSTCYITGWGRTGAGACCASTLQEAPATVISGAACQVEMDRCNCFAVVEDQHICLFDPGNGIGSCNGDSGGPLNCQDDNGDYLLSGITSWGISGGGQCLMTYPSVYVRVTFYEDWLDDHL